LAILESWRFVGEVASSQDTFELMVASQKQHPRCNNVRFLEHMVHACARLQARDGQLIQAPDGWAVLPPKAAGYQIIQHVIRQRGLARISRCAGFPHGFLLEASELLSRWSAQCGVTDFDVPVWPVATPLALALASGVWAGDVSTLLKRNDMGAQQLTLGPSAYALRRFLGGQSFPRARACFHSAKFGLEDGLRLRVGQFVANQANVGKAMEASLVAVAVVAPELAEVLSKVQVAKPSRWTLARKRVSLDMAMMLWRRSWAASAGPVCRYVAFDASPQRGREIFATVERVVKLGDIAVWVDSPDGQLPPVEDRRLPLCTLGALRMGLAEKL